MSSLLCIRGGRPPVSTDCHIPGKFNTSNNMQLQNVILVVPLLFQATFASPTVQHVDERSTSSQPLCGVVGYDCGKYVLNKAQCSVAQCEALCKKNSKCKSYGYGQNTCRLYSAVVKDNVTRKSGSPYKFYDRACPCPSSVTAPRTTTSAKQATTASLMTVSTCFTFGSALRLS